MKVVQKAVTSWTTYSLSVHRMVLFTSVVLLGVWMCLHCSVFARTVDEITHLSWMCHLLLHWQVSKIYDDGQIDQTVYAVDISMHFTLDV